jgi:predicted regulator of Ras-like GTPase activity (Roadblock/LC7/MglB family)
MDFSQLFSIISVMGAVLFFSAGFSLAVLKSGRMQDKADTTFEQASGPAQDSALRELAARESAVFEALAGESAARQAAASDAATRQAECETLRSELAACQAALQLARGQVEPDALARRAEALDAECTGLRTNLKAANAEVARLRSHLADLERRASLGTSTLPPPVVDVASSGTSFQGILTRLSKTKGMRAAVLGDALGLPVASFGEQSESLAGFCGFISQAASKARDFLQLGSIRRIVIEDERLSTLTACSIAGTDIFLATLTSGPGPEIARMVQVLNDVESFMSKRSRA